MVWLTLTNVPVGIVVNTHNASTFSPYNPNETLGDVSPTTPKPAAAPAAKKKKHGCGGVGQILMVIVAVVVTIYTAGAAAYALGATTGVTSAGAAGMAALGGSLTVTGGLGAIAAGAIGGAVGSIASQAVGIATGVQDKFSWNAVAMAGVSGAIGGALPAKSLTWYQAAGREAAVSAASQGIAVATGLQDKFSWAGVAAAGVGAGAGRAVGGRLPTGIGRTATTAIVGEASALGNAATRSLIDGSDFGDNVLAAIPDVIGQTIGEGIAGKIASLGRQPTDAELRQAAIERGIRDAEGNHALPGMFAENEYAGNRVDGSGGGGGHGGFFGWLEHGVESIWHGFTGAVGSVGYSVLSLFSGRSTSDVTMNSSGEVIVTGHRDRGSQAYAPRSQ